MQISDPAQQSSSDIVVERVAEHVVQLRLNKPERLNALGWALVIRLRKEVEAAVASGARVLLIRGTGRSFCSGADLKERRDMEHSDYANHNADINRAIDAIAAAPIPTIAVLNGLALGGGCELALACDFRLAASDIQIGFTEVRVGAMPGGGGTQRLPPLVGPSRALELMVLGMPIDAERAVAIGLVNDVVSGEMLDQRALAMASLIASRSPFGVREIKATLRESAGCSVEEGLKLERAALARVHASADYAEGLKAFAEKRPPVFGKDQA